MKKLKWQNMFMLAAFLIAGILAACSDSKDEPTPVPPPNPGGDDELYIRINPDIVNFESISADSMMIHIESNVLWKIKATANWCTFSKYSGEGNDSVMVYVGDNDQVDKRSGEIILTGAKEDVKVPIVQFGRTVQFLTFIGGEEIVGDTVDFDFEGYDYYFSFLSNVSFTATLDANSKNIWLAEQPQSTNEDQSNYPGYGKLRRILVRFLDNPTSEERISFYVLKHTGGSKTDTIYLRQQAHENFLRFFADTVYVGSHFRRLNVLGWGDIKWKYEFIDDDDRLAPTPDWIRNIEWVGDCDNSQPLRLGKDQGIKADLEVNRSSQPRHCRIRFFYNVGGKAMENIVTVVQAENNGWKSDSLVLMEIARRNSPPLGLNVEDWGQLKAQSMLEWTNIGYEMGTEGSYRITKLLMGGTGMMYELTPDICNLTELKVLNLKGCFLSGPLPKEVGMLENLEIIDLTDNFNDNIEYGAVDAGITDIPAEVFQGCTKLKQLLLSNNRFKALPAGIGNLENLEELDISSNQITSFPMSELGSLKNVRRLQMSNNPYKGEFPEGIFDLPLLEEVALDNMNFEGNAMPDKFDQLSLLRNFSASFCNIGGSLPASLSHCKRLRFFQVSADAKATAWLTGDLPASYGQLDSLEVLALSDNKITGTIPDSYVHLLDLWKRTKQSFGGLWLNGNMMGGSISEAITTHPCWTGKRIETTDPETGSQVEVSLGNIMPKNQICPQRAGAPGFDACQK